MNDRRDVAGDDVMASGEISPAPPNSGPTGESGAGPSGKDSAQVAAAARVAAGGAKTGGENFHQGVPGRLAAVKVPDAPPTAWRVPEETVSQVLTFVACGYSLRGAAEAVGRSHSTFVKLKQRDPKFAARLLQHRQLARNKPLLAMQQASERSWRAAAWLLNYLDGLERRPRAQRAAPRTPGQVVKAADPSDDSEVSSE